MARSDVRIKIKVDANTGELIVSNREFGKMAKGVDRASTSMTRFHKRVSQMAHWGAIIYGVKQGFDGLFNVTNDFLQTSMEFEKFETVLTTLEGSSTKAKQSMDWIVDFTKKTPYELNQVTEAFVKMKSYGIEPTDGTLKTLGNTASAMGKDLNQAVEAMADAVTGENERLKEFGIRAKVEGDKVAYSWATASGQAKHIVVENNREVIASTLEAIFSSKYEGAMVAQAKTFQGMISNIKDNWTILKKSIMDNGLFNYFKATATVISKMFKESFMDMADAGKTGSNYLINTFEKVVKGAGHIIDAVDYVRVGINGWLIILESARLGWKKITVAVKEVANELIEMNNSFADTWLGSKIVQGKITPFSIDKTAIEKDIKESKERISSLLNTSNELLNRNMSVESEKVISNINEEFKKIKNNIEDIPPPNIEFGVEGTLKDFEKKSEETFKKVGDSFETNFSNKFTDALMEGKMNFNDFANSIMSDITRIIMQQQIAAPLAQGLSSFGGSMFGTLFNAHGNAFVNGEVQAFAHGGVVSSPTFFGHSGGLGVAGEAGSEVIAPLYRHGADMGVKSLPSKVSLNITNNTNQEIAAENINEFTRTNERGEAERVISIVIDGVSRNKHGLRDLLRNV